MEKRLLGKMEELGIGSGFELLMFSKLAVEKCGMVSALCVTTFGASISSWLISFSWVDPTSRSTSISFLLPLSLILRLGFSSLLCSLSLVFSCSYIEGSIRGEALLISVIILIVFYNLQLNSYGVYGLKFPFSMSLDSSTSTNTLLLPGWMKEFLVLRFLRRD